MPKPLSNEGGDAFEVKRFFFPNAEKDRRGAKVLPVKHFVFGVSNVVFGTLGDVGLDVGEDGVAAAGFPCIFSGSEMDRK